MGKDLLAINNVPEIARLHQIWLDTENNTVSKGRRAELNGMYLRGVNLKGVNLARAYLQGVFFARANLTGANLSFTESDTSCFRNADLTGANLAGSDFSRCNFVHTDLTGVNLNGAFLIASNMIGTNLTGANLREAELTDADLTGANLTGADLTNAHLRDAILDGVNLQGAKLGNPTEILRAKWGDLSDEVCVQLMRLNASGISDPTAFDRWAAGDPDGLYYGGQFTGIVNIIDKPGLWSPGPPPTIYEAVKMILDEKCPGWDVKST